MKSKLLKVAEVVFGWLRRLIEIVEWIFRRLLVGMLLSLTTCFVAGLLGFTPDKTDRVIKSQTQAVASEPQQMPIEFATFGKLDRHTIKYICEQAEARQIACPIALALVQQESRGDPWASSPVGAMGLMQVMPATARQQCREVKSPQMLWDTLTNIRCGLTVLRNCLDANKDDVFRALYCYNGSPACAENCRNENNTIVCINRCAETYRYARQVVSNINKVEVEK